MYEHAAPDPQAIENGAQTRILWITDGSKTPPPWAHAGPGRFSVAVLSAVEIADERLPVAAVDAIVVEVGEAPPNPQDLAALRRRLGNPAVLVHARRYSEPAARLARELGHGASAFPADATPSVQSQLISFAAECARLTAALEQRATMLEHRNRELERSRARFHDVIEHNADAIVVVDGEGVIRFANGVASDLFRTPRENLLGNHFGFPVVAGETTELDLLLTDSPRVVEMRVVDSEWEGGPAHIASLRDITERKRSEADARRLIQERTARTTAENAARRLRFLAEATTILTLPLDYRETLATLGRLCVDELCDWVVVYTVDGDEQVRRLEVAHRDPLKSDLVAALREDPIDTGGPHPVLEVLRDRVPRLFTDIDQFRLAQMAQSDRHLELMRNLGVASFMLVPMVARDRGIGAIALVSADPQRQFTSEDLAEAADLALRAALAVDNARLLAEANDANKAKTDLLAVISHDLRTPLNAIMGHADLLALGIPERLTEAALERVSRIQMSASHLVYLIDQLLTFARLDGGREELHFEDVEARALAAEVAALVEPLALERNLRFELQLPESPASLRTDPNRLRQVLLNLTGNAIKYTPQGSVQFELRVPEEGRIEFVVRDTGVGIAPENLGRIFDAFWQVDPSQRSASGGTGLGLSVVRGLVHLLGGKVCVESELGRGSTFSVELPVCPPETGAGKPEA